MRTDCSICGAEALGKDTIAINKKLLGKGVSHFYCLECLAEFLGCTVEDILDKIEDFKEEGCELFK